MTIKINEYITVSCTDAVGQEIQAQMREEQIERENYEYLKKVEKMLRAAKNDDEFYAIYNDSCYSDIFKDLNGFRPHGMIEWFKTY